MNRALFVTLEYPPQIGGIGEYHRALVASSDWIDVLAPGSFEPTDEKNRIWRGRFFWSAWPRWAPLFWTVWRIVRTRGYAMVVVSHMLPAGTVAYALWRLAGFPYSVILHGMDIAIVRGVKARLARMILRNAQWIICNANATRNDALSVGAPRDRCIVITPCPSVAASPRISPVSLKIQDERSDESAIRPWRLLTIGRLVERKGFDTAIEVVAALNRRGNAAHLTIVGDGPDRDRLERIVDVLGFGASIVFAGVQRVESIHVFYEQADCFLYFPRTLESGDTEGFGIVCLEAALFGLPVVVSAGTGAEETVVDSVTGIVTDPTNIQKIVYDIETLLKHPERCRSMGAAGRNRVLNDFRWQQRAEQLKSILLA